jgi:hypothetical protein
MLDGLPSGAELRIGKWELQPRFFEPSDFHLFIANQAYPALIGVTQPIARPIARLLLAFQNKVYIR